MSILHPDSVGKVRKIFQFWAVFRDSAADCTKPTLRTGGTVKFDLKAFDDGLHFALTGASNRQTLDNFARAAARFAERPELPLVVASTLLVPGYVTPDEVERLARFIAAINSNIPYALLGFAPNFYMPDLPCTSVRHAEAALAAACAAGLANVRIGNRQLTMLATAIAASPWDSHRRKFFDRFLRLTRTVG